MSLYFLFEENRTEMCMKSLIFIHYFVSTRIFELSDRGDFSSIPRLLDMWITLRLLSKVVHRLQFFNRTGASSLRFVLLRNEDKLGYQR